ncbi:hypothetical protein BU25DRAFT_411298 [Macroventuria anomochaeta]|uniref:Uncharacterized protein n=1 Tax=Macroventuria anomochaeta TaxID=301207 RepID=A0ACB6RYB8_9PLEO|nr:uncharacterized protein BU25DRAFT_411298 [Macroventuria anomochaeta]KAF2626764.1 hypothetical protein BU25DRAFT_411298 [Macroventuria anomochaeta]
MPSIQQQQQQQQQLPFSVPMPKHTHIHPIHPIHHTMQHPRPDAEANPSQPATVPG